LRDNHAGPDGFLIGQHGGGVPSAVDGPVDPAGVAAPA
jgi:hypothetical protein